MHLGYACQCVRRQTYAVSLMTSH